jgi:glycerol-3-phosphate cytidylyltransferase
MNPELPRPGARVVLTYGTFDLFHIGHLNLLRRLKALGDYLIVAVSTDEFNRGKGKQTIIKFEDRLEIVQNIKFVDLAIPETCWEQKLDDVKNFGVSVFAMGDDWAGKFDFLKPHCEVVYLSRTADISSSSIKNSLRIYSPEQLERMRSALAATAMVAGASEGIRPSAEVRDRGDKAA